MDSPNPQHSLDFGPWRTPATYESGTDASGAIAFCFRMAIDSINSFVSGTRNAVPTRSRALCREPRGPMKSPADMKIIQIDLTNACHKACSNCTRFCGEHAKPFMMEMETFKKAVDSLEGFEGKVGIMGGEPTLNPKFDEMMDYYASKVPEPRPAAFIGDPTPSFKDYGRTVKYMKGRKRALFSALGPGYYKHFEKIQDTFPYQNLNDHQALNTHQALLVTRKELGIPDEEWHKLRDNCWIQNLWSAAITPKGAFFCEVAGALDMLFNGPGGWPIEPGWWKRKPSEFGDQLNWCEMCSAALKVPANPANDETDIVSPKMLVKLKEVNGPKIRQNHFVILDTNTYDHTKQKGHKADSIWYFPQNERDEARISPANVLMRPHSIDIAIREGESERVTLTRERVSSLDIKDWVAVFRDPASINSQFVESAAQCILNPGCIYSYGDTVWLFNKRARALKGKTAISLDSTLHQLWEPRKRIRLKAYPDVRKRTPLQRFKLKMKQLGNRAAFLLPG